MITLTQPKQYSGSENANYMRLMSNHFSNLGFRFKVEYFDGNTRLFDPIYLVPSTSTGGSIVVDVNKIMRNYVELHKEQQLLPRFYPDKHTIEYNIKVTEQYQKSIQFTGQIINYNDYYKTHLVANNHGLNVGDIIRIENTSVVKYPTLTYPFSDQYYNDKYNGIHQVTDVMDQNNFKIDLPLVGLFQSISGDIYFNDSRLELGDSDETDNLYITYGFKHNIQLLQQSSVFYDNDYSVTLSNPFIDNKISLYQWQYYWINIFENKQNIVRTIRFFDDTNTDTYNISNAVQKNKMIQINPNRIPAIQNEYKDYSFQLLDEFDNIILERKVKSKQGCLYQNQIIFYDNMGNLISLPFTRRLDKEIKANQTNHIHHKHSHSHYLDNDYIINTQANIERTLTIGEDWLEYHEYNKLEDLLRSPYKWFIDENNYPIPIELVDSNISLIDEHNNRFKVELKIKL